MRAHLHFSDRKTSMVSKSTRHSMGIIVFIIISCILYLTSSALVSTVEILLIITLTSRKPRISTATNTDKPVLDAIDLWCDLAICVLLCECKSGLTCFSLEDIAAAFFLYSWLMVVSEIVRPGPV